MSERMEWRVVCADGRQHGEHRYDEPGETWVRRRVAELNAAQTYALSSRCGPHRVQSRTVSTSEWADTDVTG